MNKIVKKYLKTTNIDENIGSDMAERFKNLLNSVKTLNTSAGVETIRKSILMFLDMVSAAGMEDEVLSLINKHLGTRFASIADIERLKILNPSQIDQFTRSIERRDTSFNPNPNKKGKFDFSGDDGDDGDDDLSESNYIQTLEYIVTTGRFLVLAGGIIVKLRAGDTDKKTILLALLGLVIMTGKVFIKDKDAL